MGCMGLLCGHDCEKEDIGAAYGSEAMIQILPVLWEEEDSASKTTC